MERALSISPLFAISITFLLTACIQDLEAQTTPVPAPGPGDGPETDNEHENIELGFIQNCAVLPKFGPSSSSSSHITPAPEIVEELNGDGSIISGSNFTWSPYETYNYYANKSTSSSNNSSDDRNRDDEIQAQLMTVSESESAESWYFHHLRKLLNSGTRSTWFEVKCSRRFQQDVDNQTTPSKGDKVKLCTKTGPEGELLVRDWSWKWAAVPESMYCIVNRQPGSAESLQEGETSTENYGHESVVTLDENVLGSICSEYFDKPTEIWANVTTIRVALGILVSITSFFFIFILVVLLKQWNQQGLPGWLTISLVITMFLLHIIKGPEHVWGTTSNSQTESPSLLCTLVGISIHFLHLSSFCWMTVLSFDIWWTFRNLNLKAKQSRNVLRFLIYVTFAFGVPGVIVGIGLFLERFYGEGDCGLVITPRYGSGICYLQPPALAPYLMYPVALLVATNICFFCSTAFNLKRHRKSSSMARENLTQNSEQLALYWKLFFTMGIPWTCAMISALFNLGAIWTIGMILCILQPVSIFVIFMCTSDMQRTVKNTFQKWKK